MGAERGEGGLAMARAALVHVMADILGEAGQHALRIAGVEGLEIAPDQRFGLGNGHGGLPDLPGRLPQSGAGPMTRSGRAPPPSDIGVVRGPQIMPSSSDCTAKGPACCVGPARTGQRIGPRRRSAAALNTWSVGWV